MIQAGSGTLMAPRHRRGIQVSPVVGVAGITRYRDAVLADSPVAYYRLAEPSGITATDLIGSFNGTYVNTPTLGATSAISDTGDKAVTFTAASSQRVDASSPTAVTNNYALEAWVKLPSLTTQDALFAVNGGDRAVGSGWGFGINNGDGTAAGLKLVGLLPGVSWVTTDYLFADTNFHHIVYTREAGSNKFYVDAVATGITLGGASVPSPPSTSFNIAADHNVSDTLFNRYFNGTLDEVAVYATALTSARVTAHFNAR